MPIVPAITVAQSPLAPENVILTDTSSGSDASITSRRAYIQDSEGNYLVESGVVTDYNVWALATNPITLDVLTTDTAVTITIQWLDVSNNVLYSFDDEYCLAEFNKGFLYYLEQQLSLNPGIQQDANYDANVSIFWSNIRGALNAVSTGDDIAASQACLNRCNNMRLNQTFYF